MATRLALLGHGVTGERIAKRLDLAVPGCKIVYVDARGDLSAASGCDAAVLAQGGSHVGAATQLIERGIPVVSIADRLSDIRAMVDLDDDARLHAVPLVVGAGMSPGLTGLLARYVADKLDVCDEIHVAIHGTAGPACARQHHDALAGWAFGLHDGERITRPAGSGRELCWFPEPVGAYDCYRAELPSPMLLHETFPEVSRISARMSANRRDRLTARLPMLSPPHREGGVGAVRVEVRGAVATGARMTYVVGIAEQVASAAAATAVAFTVAALDGQTARRGRHGRRRTPRHGCIVEDDRATGRPAAGVHGRSLHGGQRRRNRRSGAVTGAGFELPWLPPGQIVAAEGRGEFFVRRHRHPDADAPRRRCCCTAGRRRPTCSSSRPTKRLPEHCSFVAIDHRGHGRGLRTPDVFTLEDAADDAAAVVRCTRHRRGHRRRLLDGRPDQPARRATPSRVW